MALPGFAWDFLLMNGAVESDRVSGSGKRIRVSLAVKGAVKCTSKCMESAEHTNEHFVAHFVPTLSRIHLIDPLEPAFGVCARAVIDKSHAKPGIAHFSRHAAAESAQNWSRIAPPKITLSVSISSSASLIPLQLSTR